MGSIFKFNGGKEDKPTENKIQAFNEWERRIGKIARNKTICETSVILFGQKNEKDEVIYGILTGSEGIIAISEKKLLDEYQIEE